MDIEDGIGILGKVLSAFGRVLLEVTWEGLIDRVGWFLGWPICRLMTLGKLPKAGWLSHEEASNAAIWVVGLTGLITFLPYSH